MSYATMLYQECLASHPLRMFKDCLYGMFDHYPVYKKKEIAVIQWVLWYARNKLYHERIVQGVRDVVIFVRGYFSKIAMLVSSVGQTFPCK